jgi:hypothetical protein
MVPLAGKSDICLFDIQGRLLRRFSAESPAAGFAAMSRMVNRLPNGVYLGTLKAGGKTICRRFAQVN